MMANVWLIVFIAVWLIVMLAALHGVLNCIAALEKRVALNASAIATLLKSNEFLHGAVEELNERTGDE